VDAEIVNLIIFCCGQFMVRCDHYMTSVDVGPVVWLRFPAHVIFEPFGRS